MSGRILLFPVKPRQPPARRSAQIGFAPSVGMAHLAALRRGFGFMAATLLLILPMAVAGRCGPTARQVGKPAIELAPSQARIFDIRLNLLRRIALNPRKFSRAFPARVF